MCRGTPVAAGSAGIGDGLLPERGQRQLARPEAERRVRAVAVIGRPAADLDRRLVQGHREQPGRGQFLAAGPPRVVPLPGSQVLGQGAQTGDLLVRIGDQPRRGVDHRAAVVDRVLEHRTGQHQAIQHRDGQAGRRVVAVQAAAGHRTVHVDLLVVESVAGRHHHGHAIHDDAQMSHQPGPQHGEQLRPVAAALLAQPPVPGARRRRQHLRSGLSVRIGHRFRSRTTESVVRRSLRNRFKLFPNALAGVRRVPPSRPRRSRRR